ncbi:uncharacterized protein LOC118750036 [Rhagoletis pomonella]|uniref:uncharacterized protein LOC118750036 n=1 Tax=Rhagoletis pomonella TaxID=28610 RepID=UPI0017853170|nr:uncharacterized protein LOC118750036 [Rhagoletis pomonella]
MSNYEAPTALVSSPDQPAPRGRGLGCNCEQVFYGRSGHSTDSGAVDIQGQVRGLKGTHSKVIWDLSVERPRACVMVRNDIDFFCITEFLSQDLVAVQATLWVEGRPRDIVFAAAYFPGDNHSIPPAEVQDLVEHCRRARLPLILGSDANAHHVEWGSTDINKVNKGHRLQAT